MAFMNVETAFKFCTLLLIDLVALIGNSLILWTGFRSEELRKYNNAFIFNMAIADLGQSIFIIPFGLASVLARQWPLSLTACKVIALLKVIITLVSVQSLAGISLDRYFYIVKRKQAISSRKRLIFSISLAWMNGIILAISPLLGWGELGFDDGKEICTILFHSNLSHTLTVFCIGLFIPVSIMSFCYYKIYKTLHVTTVKLNQVMHSNLAKSSTEVESSEQVTVERGAHSGKMRMLKLGNEYASDITRVKLSDAIKEEEEHEECSEKHERSQQIVNKDRLKTICPNHEQSLCEVESSSTAHSSLKQSLSFYVRGLVQSAQKWGASGRHSGPIHDANLTGISKVKINLKASRNQNAASDKISILGFRFKRGNMTHKELRLLKSITLVIAVFILCWLPYVIFNVLRATGLVKDINAIDTMNMWMGFANSAFNPLIYGLTNPQFKSSIRKLLCSWRK